MKDLDFHIMGRGEQVNMQIVKEAIEAIEAKITSGSGAPSGGNSGDIYIDITNSRIYANISGVWKSAALI